MGEKKAEVPVGKELVRMTGIMKEFPGVKALDNVKLDCKYHCPKISLKISYSEITYKIRLRQIPYKNKLSKKPRHKSLVQHKSAKSRRHNHSDNYTHPQRRNYSKHTFFQKLPCVFTSLHRCRNQKPLMQNSTTTPFHQSNTGDTSCNLICLNMCRVIT